MHELVQLLSVHLSVHSHVYHLDLSNASVSRGTMYANFCAYFFFCIESISYFRQLPLANFCLYFHVLIFLGSIYCKQYGLRFD